MSSLWNWDPKYTLYDGPNTLITNKLPQLGIIIMCASNIIRKIFGRTGKTSRKFVTFVYFIVTAVAAAVKNAKYLAPKLVYSGDDVTFWI